jgi:hypothetical protein
MPAVRKKREAKQPSIDTSKLKEFTGGSSSSKHERRMAFAKRVKKESEDIQSQISLEQEKAGKRSLWSSIGGALGGLAAGIASGGTTWALQGAAVGLGTYLGAHGGKTAAEDPNVGKAGRKKIKSDMFYESEAHKQNVAFTDFDTKLNEGILNRSLAAGLLTAAVAGGGKLIEKIKLEKARAAAETAKVAKKVAKTKQGFQTVMATDLSGTAASTGEAVFSTVQQRANELGAISEGLNMGMDLSSVKTVATESAPALKTAVASKITKPSTVEEGVEMLKGITEEYSSVVPEEISFATSPSSLEIRKTPFDTSVKSQLAAVTPFSTQAAPSLMKSYMAGLQGMASDYAQKSILAGGAMSLYGYRPEMQELRPIQMITSPYQTQQRTRTA